MCINGSILLTSNFIYLFSKRLKKRVFTVQTEASNVDHILFRPSSFKILFLIFNSFCSRCLVLYISYILLKWIIFHFVGYFNSHIFHCFKNIFLCLVQFQLQLFHRSYCRLSYFQYSIVIFISFVHSSQMNKKL